MSHPKRILTSTATVALVALLTSTAAFAASPTPKAHAACQADIAKFCKGVAPGAGRIYACLEEHSDKLSSACQKELKAVVSERREHATPGSGGTSTSAPCLGDIQKFCKDVQPGGGRVKVCLAQHKAELSDTCKASMQKKTSK